MSLSELPPLSPGPSYREDVMYKVQFSPIQLLRPILFPFKVGCVLLSDFLAKCLQSPFTTVTTTCGMLGCIKFVGRGFLNLIICLHFKIGFIDESTQLDNWFMPAEENVQAGVAIRVETGFFRVFPYENTALIPFEVAVRRLNPVVAVKIRNAAVQAAIRKMYVMLFYFWWRWVS